MDGDPPVLPYAHPNVGETRLIARFNQATLGYLAAGKLEAAGIRCGLNVSRSAYFGNDSASLSVVEEDVPRAVEILSTTPAGPYLLVDLVQPLEAAVRVCPKCRSADVVRERQLVKLAVGVLALAGLAWMGQWGWFAGGEALWVCIWAITRKASCRACGWRDWISDLEQR